MTRKASWPPALAGCSGVAVGKFVDEVKPVIYALLDASSARGFVAVTVVVLLSFALPPRYVEYRNALPLEFNFAANASNPPPLEICSGVMVGKFVDDVKPVT